jgi:DNA repair protein RadA/Sms
MLLAVLETRCGVNLGNRDVYLNVAGGLRIQEPAADLAVAAALMSALTDQALPKASLFCGEVGLSGEVRGVTHLEARLKEAQKLGFESAYIPTQGSSKIKTTATKSLEVMRLGTLQELASFFNTTSQNTPRNQPNSNVNLPEEPKRYG